jgi:CubicO group peptidase (beta-lactamase class C family)
LCSISKQFATAACLKLSEEGKLSLDEKISGYINGLPESYENIRISNLLNQTSGIKDYINEKKLYGASWEDIKRSIFSDTLNFVPGSSWSYSNTGFCLAAGIVEKITGTDYYDYIKDNIFKKLKMEKTVPVSDIQDNGVMVKGYEYENGKYVAPYLDISENNGKGDGEYVSTLNDLLKWSIGLTGGKILKEKSLHEMWSRATLNNGDTIEVFPNSGMNYGMGWFVRKIGNVDVVWTPGSGFGFSTTLQYVPKYNLTVIVFCNREKFLMADEIGEAVIRKIIKTDRFD